ncbi:MAG TPA: hypothetical protein VGD46_21330 [Rhizobacter sp.]
MISKFFMLASAGVVLALGTVHLVYTFQGHKLAPRDPAVKQAMALSPLVLTAQTTVWKAWVGFNFSHSLGAMLFGLVYGYLAVAQADMLFRSPYLLALGLAMLAALWLLARLYWFSVPMLGVSLALGLYVAGVLLRQH